MLKLGYFKQNYTLDCVLLLKWSIIFVLALKEIYKIQISSKKSFITSTTGPEPTC